MTTPVPDSTKVSAMKPLATGGVLVAPYVAGDMSYLPSDSVAPQGNVELDSSFVPLGFMDRDANVSNSEETSSEDLNAWGGALVMTTPGTRKETYSFTAIEQNARVWKLRYGDSSVVGDDANAVVKHDGSSFDGYHSIITAEKLGDGRIHLSVIPKAQLSEADTINHPDNTALMYPMTFTALDYDGAGTTSYDVYYTPTSVTTTSVTTTS